MKINFSRQKNERQLAENANYNQRGQGKKKYFCRWNSIHTWLDAALQVL